MATRTPLTYTAALPRPGPFRAIQAIERPLKLIDALAPALLDRFVAAPRNGVPTDVRRVPLGVFRISPTVFETWVGYVALRSATGDQRQLPIRNPTHNTDLAGSTSPKRHRFYWPSRAFHAIDVVEGLACQCPECPSIASLRAELLSAGPVYGLCIEWARRLQRHFCMRGAAK